MITVITLDTLAALPPGSYRCQDDPPSTGTVYRYDCMTWEPKTGRAWVRWFVEVER